MSRDIRVKPSATPVSKAAKRRGSDSSSSLDLSSDDGYSALDEISDSEDDDEDVYAAEEEHIINNELRRKQAASTSSPRPGQDDDEDADEEDEDEDDDEDEVDVDEDAEEEDEEDAEEGAQDHASWDGILSDVHEHPEAQTPSNGYLADQDVTVDRHVRFVGVPDSDSDSTDSDTTNDIEDFFPDIFVSQDSLDSKFRREIEQDPDDSSNSGSYWDFSNAYGFPVESDAEDAWPQQSKDATPVATPMPSLPPTEASTPVTSPTTQDLEGYETDGDTTEEDTPEPPVRRKPAKRSQTADDSGSDTDKPIKYRKGQPRIGRFNLDSSERKPICVVNPISRKMMIFTPQKLRRLDLAPESFNFDFFTNPSTTQSSPILSNSASLMMSAMFSSNTFGDFMNTQAIGPAEAFFSVPSDAVTADETEDSEMDDEEDEEERNLKLEDFITFEDHSSGGEEDDKDDLSNWDEDMNGSVASTPRRPSTAASTRSDVSMGLHPLLNHFDNNSNAVGAFRRNQVNQQLIFSDKATQESLAFSSPYYHGTLKGIKNGSLETVTAPITPVRRVKRSNMGGFRHPANDLTRSPLESMSQKRKASAGMGESHHKRHRSISDVRTLHL